MKKRVSIIISNRNDDAMLSVTVRSLLEELRALDRNGEIIVMDNSDQKTWDRLRTGAFIPRKYFHQGLVQLYRQDFPCLFTAREMAVKKAKSDLILCVDGHMVIGHRMVADLVEFMEKNEGNEKIGFVHAPISWCHQHEEQAKHDRNMSKHELGDWNNVYKEERRITWKGMPWIVRKNVFWDIGGYGCLAKHRISWGGGDMHLGIKPWLLGYENWALPCSPAIHIGPFPESVKDVHKYRVYSDSGNYPASFGFLMSCYVLGGTSMINRNKKIIKERFGWRNKFEEHIEIAKKLAEEEKNWLDKRKIMNFQELLQKKPWDDNDTT